jgi:ribosomal protein S6
MKTMDNQDKDKKEYELAVLVPREEDVAAVVALVREHNGDISAEPRAKKIVLAYEIKKHKEAIFAYFNFKAFGEDVKNLEHEMNIKAEIIRSLVVIAIPFDASEERASSASAMAAASANAPQRRPRMTRSAAPTEQKAPASSTLSNEALEKKIEEILK